MSLRIAYLKRSQQVGRLSPTHGFGIGSKCYLNIVNLRHLAVIRKPTSDVRPVFGRL